MTNDTPEPKCMVITRTLDAPRARVWQAWSDAAQLDAWWGPNGFTTTTKRHDFSPGGAWRYTMHGPDGRDYENRVTYVEIVPEERLVYRHDDGDADDPCEPVRFDVTVHFADDDDDPARTALEITMRFASDADRTFVNETYGADHGAVEWIGNLDALLERRASHAWHRAVTALRPEETRLIISRVFDASIERLWDAWTTPAHLAQWFCPRECTLLESVASIEVGGTYRTTMRCNGDEHTMTGTYQVVEPMTQLTFTHQWTRDGAPNTVVDVRLRGVAPNVTELRLEQRGLSDERNTIDHTGGWSSCFEHLADHLRAVAPTTA